jgi:hypothetical protein
VTRFHALEPFDAVPARSYADELRNLETIRRRLATCGWPVKAPWERLHGRLQDGLARLHAGAPAWLHRDLYEQQLLADSSGAMRLVDLDTAAPGNREIDIGNFIAHLELAAFEGARRDRVQDLTARLASIDGLDSAALDWCVAATHARLVLVHGPRAAGTEVAAFCGTRAAAWFAGGAVPSRVS